MPIRAALAGLALAGLAALGTASAQTVRVDYTPAEAAAAAGRALSLGRADLAVQIAAALTRQDPARAEGWALLASGLARQGALAEAWEAADQALDLAQTRDDRFKARLAMAEVLAVGQRDLGADWWLRRALDSARTPDERSAVRSLRGQVLARRRVSAEVSLGFGPSSNANGGSLHDTFWFMGIPLPIDAAAQGWAADAGLALRYRLPSGPSASHALVARIGHRQSWYEDRTGQSLELGQSWASLGYEGSVLISPQTKLALSVSAGSHQTEGQRDYDLRSASIGLAHLFSPALKGELSLAYSGRHHPARPSADRDQFTLAAEGTVGTRLGTFTLGAGTTLTDSQAAGVAWRGPFVQAGWSNPVFGGAAMLSAQLRAEQRSYWLAPQFAPDRLVSGGISARIDSVSLLGLSPEIGLSGSRTRSEVVVRDSSELALSFRFQSQF